jgi:hypothetical protein
VQAAVRARSIEGGFRTERVRGTRHGRRDGGGRGRSVPGRTFPKAANLQIRKLDPERRVRPIASGSCKGCGGWERAIATDGPMASHGALNHGHGPTADTVQLPSGARCGSSTSSVACPDPEAGEERVVNGRVRTHGTPSTSSCRL